MLDEFVVVHLIDFSLLTYDVKHKIGELSNKHCQSKNMNVPADVQNNYKRALEALNNSYSPYSKLQVACALQTKEAGVIVGVNVENASYGGTICAERSAFVSAISQLGADVGFEYLVVLSSFEGEPIPPCGMCLQVIRELCGDDFKIYLADRNGIEAMRTLKEFLPHSFSSEMLPE